LIGVLANMSLGSLNKGGRQRHSAWLKQLITGCQTVNATRPARVGGWGYVQPNADDNLWSAVADLSPTWPE
jgi:hypothetical protein